MRRRLFPHPATLLLPAALFSTAGCASRSSNTPEPREVRSIRVGELREKAIQEADRDPLVGIWTGTQCGSTVTLAVVPADGRLEAFVLNGHEIGYGYDGGHPWFRASALAASGTYAGEVVYRNVFMRRWFPTRIIMEGADAFTTYDDVFGMQTCGGTVHTYLRKVPSRHRRAAGVLGSGFLLRGTDLIMTAAHVVAGSDRLRVRIPASGDYDGELVAIDEENDLALVRLAAFSSAGDAGLSVDPSESALIGERIHALGYPLGPELSDEPSVVSGQVSSLVGPKKSANQFRMTAPINPGNSGGPVIDSEGHVVGIAVSAIRHESVEGIAFGIKASAASAILGAVTAIDTTSGPSQVLTATEVYQRFAQLVALLYSNPVD